ncbi:hypothetical protein BgAZ_501790 [Babesia gibsoni]|uniref:Uncharacterized protein n=1 Tax=Babesia gibsoni TaxID=33632 RepID=A0AAD8LHT9_BABGI|nr:hypothetical protein BgAZ_501790 [Babesia gibsoni]
MLNELECVWTALFGECISSGLKHNEHVLNSSIAAELAEGDGEVLPRRNHDKKLYSLKRVLQSILDNGDAELTEVALEAVFRVREDLVNAFKAVAQDQAFDKMHADALKLIIIDALNRKVKELNPDFIATTTDVTNVDTVRGYFAASSQLKQLVSSIKSVDKEIEDANAAIHKAKLQMEKVEEYITALKNKK